jgi:hypothetical protein
MKKRLLSLALAWVLVFAPVPAAPAAAAITAPPTDSIIQDPGFYAAVLEIINKPYGYSITPADAAEITQLSVNWSGIRSLAGIEYFTELMRLECIGNELTELDVSKNINLINLQCGNNKLTALNTSNLTELMWLSCGNNRIAELDLSKNTELWSLSAGHNRLTELDISNNIKLAAIIVNHNRLTALDVRKNTDLLSLSVEFNRLTELDVSKNTDLGYLICGYNYLTDLNVSNNPRMYTLFCEFNDLAALDTGKNTALLNLRCGGNLFTSVNTANNPNLTTFSIEGDREQYENNLAVFNSKRTDRAALDFYLQPSRNIQSGDAEIMALANDITSGITEDYEKALEINYWIAENIYYDNDVYYRRAPRGDQSATGALQLRRGVCEGIARLTVALLRASGIPAKYLTGPVLYFNTVPVLHAWSEAYVDGRWIIMDTTWSGTNNFEHGEYREQRIRGRVWYHHRYFDMSVRHISISHFFDDYSEDFPNPLNTASDWAHTGITSAIGKGFVPADLQNNYQNIITRAEFCRMAVKWVEYATGKSIDAVLAEQGKSRDFNAFTDTNDPDILAAFALGITAGEGNNLFNPSGQFTRQQAATMIMNTCRAVGADVSNPPASDFTDMHLADGWAHPGINFVRANGIMSGVTTSPPFRFDPKRTYTRQESIITFNNIAFG